MHKTYDFIKDVTFYLHYSAIKMFWLQYINRPKSRGKKFVQTDEKLNKCVFCPHICIYEFPIVRTINSQTCRSFWLKQKVSSEMQKLKVWYTTEPI